MLFLLFEECTVFYETCVTQRNNNGNYIGHSQSKHTRSYSVLNPNNVFCNLFKPLDHLRSSANIDFNSLTHLCLTQFYLLK